MAKSAAHYVCQNCGASTARWSGRCENCGAWNTIIEEVPLESMPKGLSGKKGKGIALVDLGGTVPDTIRRATNMAEFDRVTGGGLVRGSAILIGGDPGIGKSTLMLQVAAMLGSMKPPLVAAYISGEEAVEQVQLR
ncbi:MAG: ATPase domain-containing protein, partial [Dongia sp.]